MPDPGKGTWIKTAMWGVAVVLVFELFIRAFFYFTPQMQQIPYMGLVPVKGSHYIWGAEGFGVTYFGDLGEVDTPYRGGTSVVVLGDSETAGLQVNNDKKFVSVAESILRQRGLQADLHNLGGAGRNIADYVYIGPYIIENYDPKIVVVQVSRLDFIDSFDPARSSHFVKTENGIELVHIEKNYAVSIQNVARRSGLVSFSLSRLESELDRMNKKYKTNKTRMPFLPDDPQFQAEQDVLISAQIDALREAYPGIELVILVIPSSVSFVDNDYQFDQTMDVAFVESIRTVSKQDVVYPLKEFLDLYQHQRKFPRGFSNSIPGVGHMNSIGHSIVGQVLADHLEDRLR